MRRRLLTLTQVALAAGVVAAQTANPPQPFRSQANYVRVDVYPTRAGKPVLDLRAEDFEILEDGRPQAIAAFEHITASAAIPVSSRPDPGTTEGMKQAAAVPRGRVFVLFLDAGHVTTWGSGRIAEPLIRMVDRLVGPDDLFGVMTPDMPVSQLVLGHKTEMLERGLRTNPIWGRRFDQTKFDQREQDYANCYPLLRQERAMGRQLSEVTQMLIDRRREKLTLDSLNELVAYLGNLSDVRKTIVTISEGWVLFRPEEALLQPRPHPDDEKRNPNDLPVTDPVPGKPGIVVRNGTIRTDVKNDLASALYKCETDRMQLAALDDARYFQGIIGDANRANASFYTIDPRGLAVFNSDVNVDAPSIVGLRLAYDAAMLRTAQDSMRTLAENTDGMAVLHSNDLDAGLKRMTEDLTSYYLLGYYSTNSKLDGKFHEIKVRIKRTGVDVRARRGYRSATAAEVASARATAAASMPEPLSAIASAVASLVRIDAPGRLRINATPVPGGSSADVVAVWVSGELRGGRGGNDDWSGGGTATIELSLNDRTATAVVALPPGQQAFLTPVVLRVPAGSGDLLAKVKLTGSAGTLTDGIRIDAAGSVLRPVVFRRGPSTGNRLQPVADFQFSRTERARFEVPLVVDAKPGTGRLLDRSAQPLTLPVVIGERTDAETGQRWMTADISLAALGIGEYAVELGITRAGENQRIVTAIRVGR
jgi:VWFA-related protein